MSAAASSGSPRAPATAALGAVFIGVGLGFGLTVALVCGTVLLALCITAFAWVELASRRGRLERERGPGRIDERDPYPLRLRLGGTLLPPPGGEIADPLLEKPMPIGPGWPKRLDRDLWFDGPGRRRLRPARIVVRDPLGLWERTLDSGQGHELVVLPRVERVGSPEGASDPRARSAGSGSASEASSSRGGIAQFEVDGLRPYREGSPATRIHWPAVARTGEMIERRLIAGGDPRPLVALDLRDGADRPARERAMRAAASLCVALARAGGCELLLPGTRPIAIDSALRAWPEAHTRIALAEPGAAVSLPASARGAVVYWVTAGRSLPPSVRRLHPASLLITPHRSRRAALFRVAGCSAYRASDFSRRAARARVAA
jgi:uncharacterized protein (DUF58 family)